jgi:hypothetical protein
VSAARLAAHCLALLDAPGGPIAVSCPRAARLRAALAAAVPLARESDAPAAAVVAFLGARASPQERQATLRAVGHRLAPGAQLVLVDHNQPRSAWRRAVALLPLAAAGLSPARARYPAARELAVLGFLVERLRLACGERIQLISARRR